MTLNIITYTRVVQNACVGIPKEFSNSFSSSNKFLNVIMFLFSEDSLNSSISKMIMMLRSGYISGVR